MVACIISITILFIVYSTKYRKKVLTGEVGEALKKIDEEIALNNDIELIEQEVMPDHVHLFVLYLHIQSIHHQK